MPALQELSAGDHSLSSVPGRPGRARLARLAKAGQSSSLSPVGHQGTLYSVMSFLPDGGIHFVLGGHPSRPKTQLFRQEWSSDFAHHRLDLVVDP